MREAYILSLIKIGISKEKIMEEYDVSEDQYEEIKRKLICIPCRQSIRESL